MAKKKPINERCPFKEECDRKKCDFSFHEADCPYYSANAMPAMKLKTKFNRSTIYMMSRRKQNQHSYISRLANFIPILTTQEKTSAT